MAKEKAGLFKGLYNYILNLRNDSPYWRFQASMVGLFIVISILGAALFAVVGLSSVFGGGNIYYEAIGSPGPVNFSHYKHMWFQDGKYKDCKVCHDKIFAAQTYGTYTLRALRESPVRKVRIGKDTSTLYMEIKGLPEDAPLLTYKVPRACRTCATGQCHDGKESFSRLECLKCHQQR
jgi:hypothetical protein